MNHSPRRRLAPRSLSIGPSSKNRVSGGCTVFGYRRGHRVIQLEALVVSQETTMTPLSRWWRFDR
jgi:hypothetical protein